MPRRGYILIRLPCCLFVSLPANFVRLRLLVAIHNFLHPEEPPVFRRRLRRSFCCPSCELLRHLPLRHGCELRVVGRLREGGRRYLLLKSPIDWTSRFLLEGPRFDVFDSLPLQPGALTRSEDVTTDRYENFLTESVCTHSLVVGVSLLLLS